MRSPLQTNMTYIYITPPVPSLNFALTTLNCCLVVNSSSVTPYQYCNLCGIINDTFKFKIEANGIQIPIDTDFQILLMSIYNPSNATDCASFSQHLLSYFNLVFLKNDKTVTHSSLAPTSLDSPCQIYSLLRGDIVPNIPNVLYAGFVQPFSIKLSQPTKMLRVDLHYVDTVLTFLPSTFYF